MRYFFLLLISFVYLDAFSQISVDYPSNNQIFQRDANNQAPVSFLGKVSKVATKVEYQLVSIQNGSEILSNWKILDSLAVGGFYQATLNITGGLYKLKVRSFNGNKLLDSTSLNRFGVGEVFIIAGQSNAQGVERTAYQSGTENEMVFSANFSNYLPDSLATDKFTFIGYQNLNFPLDKFEVLKESSIIGPNGVNNFYWPNLGDKIANKLQVPVCFFNTAWSGTSIRNWAESSRGIASKNPWVNSFYPVGFPFENLNQVVKTYAGRNGFRAVLWQIGETDTQQKMPRETFVSYFLEVQKALKTKTGLDIPMILAQSTFIGAYDNGNCILPAKNDTIVRALNDLENLVNGNFITGPNTDLIENPRLSTPAEYCVHFSPNAFNEVANEWFKSLVNMFQLKIPVTYAYNLPIFKKYCEPNNDSKFKISNRNFDLLINNSLVNPDTNSVYSNLVGTTFKLVNNQNKNIKFDSPTYNPVSLPIPDAPIITINTSPLFCKGNEVIISTNLPSSLWSNAVEAKSITISSNGSFTATTKNQYGCVSAASNNITVKVFDNPSAPPISQPSPYFLYGGIKLFDIDFHWQLNNVDLNKSDVFLKVNRSGTYQIYATKTYNGNLTCKSPITSYTYSLPNDGGLTAYPNPVGANGSITIESVSNLNNANYQVVDAFGKVIKEGAFNSSESYKMDLNALGTGKYILNIITTDQVIYTRQLIIGK